MSSAHRNHPLVLHTPCPALRSHVDHFWHLRCGPHQSHSRERILPTTATELVIDLRDDSDLPDWTMVIGPHAGFFSIATDVRADAVGIHFRPGGAYALSRTPALHLRDTFVVPEDVFGAKIIRLLRSRLLPLTEPMDRFNILEDFLLQCLDAGPPKSHPAVAMATAAFRQQPDGPTVTEVARSTGYSSTHLVTLFRREIGIAPKLFCRIQRFRHALRQIEEQNSTLRWADLAFDCGYSDQAHMVREFREFSGYSPTSFVARRTSLVGHLREDCVSQSAPSLLSI
ncbi:MAG: helix-turn-helix transcriptional regulator [Acidobacteriota bacterium]